MQNTKKVSFYIIASVLREQRLSSNKMNLNFHAKNQVRHFHKFFSQIRKISSIRSDAIWRELKEKNSKRKNNKSNLTRIFQRKNNNKKK